MPRSKFVDLAVRVLNEASNKHLGSTNARLSTHAEENALSGIRRCEAHGATMIVVRCARGSPGSSGCAPSTSASDSS